MSVHFARRAEFWRSWLAGNLLNRSVFVYEPVKYRMTMS